MTGGTLGGFFACFEDSPVARSLVGLELVGMTSAAEGRDLVSRCDTIWRGVAGGGAVLLAFAVAGVARNSFGEVGVRLDVRCWFCVALLAELVRGGLLG